MAAIVALRPGGAQQVACILTGHSDCRCFSKSGALSRQQLCRWEPRAWPLTANTVA